MDNETRVPQQDEIGESENYEDSLRSATPKPGRPIRVDAQAAENNAKAQELLSGLIGGFEEHHAENRSQSQLMPGDVENTLPPGPSSFGGSTPNNRRNQPNNSRRQGPVTVQSTDRAPHPTPHPPPPPASAYHYPPTPSSYGQRPAFYGSGQYTMSPPAPPTIAHAHHYPYAHGHGFQVPADPGMIPQNIHANYQHMMTAPYPYQPQRQSPDKNLPSDSQTGFSNTNLYSQHGNSSPSPTFTNPGQFQSLQYPSPIPPSPRYGGYQTQTPYSYQSHQYSYPRPFGSTDPDSQRGWWYVTVAPHQPQYESTPPPPSYSTPPYTLAYSPVGHQRQHQEIERLASNSPSLMYPNQASSPPPPPLPPPSHVVHPSFHTSQPSPPSASPSPAPTPASPDPPLSRSAPPVGRKSYHPTPPAHRSEWVMWTGNVPHDATHDELWRFFTQKPATPPAQSSSGSPSSGSLSPSSSAEKWISGVVSIFLISRSSCAFVNYDGPSTLEFAIRRFNGLALRPNDPRCPRLVCRVRKKDDDLRAGVGGQRGVGMHIKYVKELGLKQIQSRKEEDSTSASSSSAFTSEQDSSENLISQAGTTTVDGSNALGKRLIPKTSGGGHSNSSGSYASTSSSILTRYFPKRFFILKSLSQYDLDLSVEKGLWATQKHNEGILDQAYRTSSEVYLIFGVNKSGEFYGYARMASPVKGEHRISWGPRADSTSSVSTRSSLSPVTGRGSVQTDVIFEEEPASPTSVLDQSFGNMGIGSGSGGGSGSSMMQFFPDHMVDESPLPVSGGLGSTSAGGAVAAMGRNSAPAELKDRHRKISLQTPATRFSLDLQKPERPPKAVSILPIMQNFQLDEEAPVRAMKNPSRGSSEGSSPEIGSGDDAVDGMVDGVLEPRGEGKGKDSASLPLEVPPPPHRGRDKEKEETWGDSFKVEWLCTDRLPFFRTKHIRNPWNHDREIKVSRDGTELEPGVGQQLIGEWERYVKEKEKEEKEKGGGGEADPLNADRILEEDSGVEGRPKLVPPMVGSSTRKSGGGGKRNG